MREAFYTAMVDKQLDTLTADRTAVGGLKGGLYFQGWTEGAPKGAARPAERLPCAYRRTQAVLALHCPWQRGEPVRPPSCNTPHGICSILCPVPRPLPPPPSSGSTSVWYTLDPAGRTGVLPADPAYTQVQRLAQGARALGSALPCPDNPRLAPVFPPTVNCPVG